MSAATTEAPAGPGLTGDGPGPTTVVVRGIDVPVRRRGDGPPVVVLHGHWAARRWLPWLDRLAERAEVIAPVMAGFTGTEPPDWYRGREDAVLVLRDLLAALDLPPVAVSGYGLGGWLAADLAVWAPERVAALALLAPFGLRVPGSPVEDVFLLNPERFADSYGLPSDALDDPDLVPGTGTPAQGGPEAWAARYTDMGTAARLMWRFRYDLALEHRLPHLDLPAVVVHGDDDRVVPDGHPQRWAELLGARTVAVDGGHAFPITAPEQTAAAVADLVQESAR